MTIIKAVILTVALAVLPSVAFAEVGKWTVRHGADKWTDEEYVTALVHTRDHSAAIVGCDDVGLFAQVRIGRYDSSPYKTRDVRWRVDYETPVNEKWRQSAKATGVLIYGPLALEFANLVARANTRLVFMNSTGTRTFKVQGNWAAIGAVLLACKGKENQ